jgi:hypothetical protein
MNEIHFDKLIDELNKADKVLEAEGYASWTYTRLSIFAAIKAIEEFKWLVPLSNINLDELREVRNYFGENDKTAFEHKAFYILDTVIKQITPIKNITQTK